MPVIKVNKVVDLPLAGIRRLMKKAGAERVTKEAVETLRDITEQFVIRIAKLAVEFAESQQRKSLMKEDIIRAIKVLSYGLSTE